MTASGPGAGEVGGIGAMRVAPTIVGAVSHWGGRDNPRGSVAVDRELAVALVGVCHSPAPHTQPWGD